MLSQTVSRYRIIEKLGEGGMGEVYKALDTALDRPVALKILPPKLVEDADRMRRFVQEAKSASALNHPHIVVIYEIGHADGEIGEASAANSEKTIHYIAMEFIGGGTIHEKIHVEKTELRKLLEYLAQVADGLAKAHSAGIIHRDLKPENLMVTEDGYAKILDFGLAKLTETAAPEESDDEFKEAATAVMDKTRPGIVMGTIGYMSPEQAQGKIIDQRSDIFSFGCILYETATGKKPFEGESLIDSLHKIVYSQALPIKDYCPQAPAELQRIIRKCLAKDPSERYQSIKEAAIDLRELLKDYDQLPTVSGPIPQIPLSEAQKPSRITDPQQQPATAQISQSPTAEHERVPSGSISEAACGLPTRKGNRRVFIGLFSVLFLMLFGIGLALKTLDKKYLDRFSFRKHLKASAVQPFQNIKITKLTNSGKIQAASISPDGKYVAHIVSDVGKQSLWVKQTAAASSVQIIPPEATLYSGVVFSPDGNFIYYTAGEKESRSHALYQVPVLGGNSKKIVENMHGEVTFSPDGKQIAFTRAFQGEGKTELMTANADGSAQKTLSIHKAPNIFILPAWSPDGKNIAGIVPSLEGGYHMELTTVRVSDADQKVLTKQKWRYVTGIVWLSDGGSLLVSGFDESPGPEQSQVWLISYKDGAARKITNDLNTYIGLSVSADSKSLLTLKTDVVSNIWTSPNGDAARAEQITSGSGGFNQVRWTPDKRIIYVSDESGAIDIWIMDADGTNRKQLTFQSGANFFPTISPDGRYVVFCANRASDSGTMLNIWRMEIDGSNPKQLTDGVTDLWPSFAPDGEWIYYTAFNNKKKPTIWKVSIEGGAPVQIMQKVSYYPEASPDGKLLACLYNDETPQAVHQLAIVPAEGGAPLITFNVKPFSTDSRLYRWSPDGKAIWYLDEKEGVVNVFSQPIKGGAPKQLTEFKRDAIFSFDWSPDGKRFVCARGSTTIDAILIKDLKEGEDKN